MSEMKNSGIEWIGDIPIDWQYSKMSYVCDIITDFTASGSFADLAKNVEYLDYEDYAMLVRAADLSAKREISRVYVNRHAYEYLHNSNLFGGEVILPNVGSIGDVYFFSPIYPRSTLAPNSLMLKSKFYSRYLFYLFSTNQGKEALLGLSNATTQAKFNKTQLRNMRVVVPNVQSVKRIVSYLDSKCAEIDALKSDIQKEIETLQEYRRSLITEAVTKGLDPDVEMKDSGIEWVGEIPVHWIVHPVYCFFRERNTRNYLGQEQNLLSLSYGNVIRKDINTNGGLLPASFKTYNIVEKDDIIIRPTDLQNDKRSLRTGLVKEHGIMTSAYIDLCPRNGVNSSYFHYLLHAYDVEKVFYNMGNGVRQGLNYSEFSKLLVFAPPINEQHQIAYFLDEKCAEIDSIIETKQKQLDTLAEYRKSLIYEYVTGKKEVV